MTLHLHSFHVLQPPYPTFKIVQSHFLATPSKQIKLFDHKPVQSYPFQCAHCGLGKFTIEVKPTIDSRLNWSYHSSFKDALPQDEIVHNGGMGDYGKFIQCTVCDSCFYIGIGYDEPNNGRDVFYLHCIWELERIS